MTLPKRILSALLVAACLLSCSQQEIEIPVPKVSFSDSLTADYESASITCSVSGNVTAEKLVMQYAKDSGLSGATSVTFTKAGYVFSASLSGLEANTTYYYRYTISNSISTYTDETVRQFQTTDYNVPTVLTGEATDISAHSATLSGEVQSTGGRPILEKGFYLGKDKDHLTPCTVQTDAFTYTATGLDGNSTYYYRAYAKTDVGEGLGLILEFSTPFIEVSSITLNKTSLTLSKGKSETLVATVFPEDASDKTVTWSSTAPSMVSVDQNGKVTAGNKGGGANIYARAGYYTAICLVVVLAPVEGVVLSNSALDMLEGDEVYLTATVKPDDATDKTVTWSSSNESVATVTDGKVVAVKPGSATITVKTVDGGFTASCPVTVGADEHHTVNLGLSVRWASMNFGAESITQTGGYYLWGDPSGTASPSMYSAPDVNTISGTQYDIVRSKWGGTWRIPSSAELQELFSKCTWEKETVDGVSVFRVTGPNGNSIIVPPTGIAFPADGPAGTTTIVSGERVYLMSATAYSSNNYRYAYIHYYSPDGSYGVDYYLADVIKEAIRPVRR